MKIAEEFIQKQLEQKKLDLNPGYKPQEFINFVQMEYFLYGLNEAYTLVTQIAAMEDHINKLNSNLDLQGQEVVKAQEKLREYENDPYRAGIRRNQYEYYEELREAFASSKNQMYNYRTKISEKETLLLCIFRELISCDFHVSKNYFDKFHSQKDIKVNNKNLPVEFFEINLDTFWKPVTNVNGEQIENMYVESDLTHERFRKKINNLEDVPEEKFYQFLPESIADVVKA